MADDPGDDRTSPQPLSTDRSIREAPGSGPSTDLNGTSDGPPAAGITVDGTTSGQFGPGDEVATLPRLGMDDSSTRPASVAPKAGPRRPLPRIPGYEIFDELGRGGMGVVYRALSVPLNRPCALKMILAGNLAGADSIRRIQLEAEAVARLQHPNVVQIYRVGDHEGCPYLELEYLEGGSLADRLDGSPWAPRKAAAMVEDLARAIAEAHRRGIVHRDLKPANVLLDAEGRPKVADFGLAKALGEDGGLTQSGAIMGTPSYMAPEQAGGHAKLVTPSADVYALGAILYVLLTGRPPFQGGSVHETLEQVRSVQPVPPTRLQPKIPRDLETICLKCLGKEPHRRYASASDLADDLRRYSDGLPIRARPIGPAGRTARWCLRHPALASLAACVGALLIALAAGGVVTARREGVLRSRAEANLARARRVVNEMYTEVAAALDDQVEMDQYQRDLLQKALRFYEDDALTQSRDPAVRHEAAWAALRAGDIQARLGRTSEAEAAYRLALGILGPLTAEHPTARPYRQTLAQVLSNLGNLLATTRRSDDALEAHRRGLGLRQALLDEQPGDDDSRRDLAASHHNLGDRHAADHRVVEAEASYREALLLKEALVRDRPKDFEARDGLANTLNNLGNLLVENGRPADAVVAYGRALGLWRTLSAERPRDTRALVRAAAASGNLGSVYKDTRRPREAEAAFQETIAICRKAIREHPLVPDYRITLAIYQYNLGSLYLQLGRTAEAEEAYKVALQTDAELAREQPSVLRHVKDLAVTWTSLGQVYYDARREKEAEEAIRNALGLWGRLLEAQPRSPEYRNNMANSHHSLGMLYRRLKRPAEAEAEYRRTLTIQRELVAQYPRVPVARDWLANTLHSLGNVLREVDRVGEAEASYREAVGLLEALDRDYPQVPEYLTDLANTSMDLADLCSETGRSSDAAAACRRAVEIMGAMPGMTPLDLYNLACLCARSATLLGRAGPGPGGDAPPYLDRAMDELRKAVAAGFSDAAHMRADPDLDPLRSRADFQALLMDLGFPRRPFAP